MGAAAWAILATCVAVGPVDFDTEVIPLLTRAGCNSGACHGAAAGRGGFKLSLLGSDPAADYRQIVQEQRGRRVNLAHPEKSLLLLKPTWQVDHEGGERFGADSPPARRLTRWVAEGAQRLAVRRLTALEVLPQAATVDRVPASIALRVVAQFDDGTRREVTDEAVFTPGDPGSTVVSGEGCVQVVRPGRHVVLIRFLSEVRAVTILAPLGPALDRPSSSSPHRTWIDEEIDRVLAAVQLQPRPVADAATLLRRLTLDLTGRLPHPRQVEAFLSDPRPLPARYEAEVERLLHCDQFDRYWSYKLASWLRLGQGSGDAPGDARWQAWLRQQIAAQRPLDEMVRTMLRATGDSHAVGPANFHRQAADPRSAAEYLTETLLGIRLRCANCHDHPLDRWRQDDYHGLAALLAGVDRGRVVAVRPLGEVIHPATGLPAVPRVPGGQPLAEGQAPLDVLAHWVTARDNPYFATFWVNRLWQALLGRGLVEPVDDLRATNPASHPRLLARLADDFVASGYDLRHTLGLIVRSEVYQRQASLSASSPGDEVFFPRALVRPLPAPVVLDMLQDVLEIDLLGDVPAEVDLQAAGRPEPRPDEATAHGDHAAPPRRRAVELVRLQDAAAQLGPLVGCRELRGCAVARDQPVSLDDLAVQLHWLNGRLLNEPLARRQHALARLADTASDLDAFLREAYLRTLSRIPSPEELAFWRRELSSDDRDARIDDFLWSLLSCPEFLTNH